MKNSIAAPSSVKGSDLWFWARSFFFFVLAFSIPVALAISLWDWNNIPFFDQSAEGGVSFPDALHISNGEKRLRIAHSSELDPVSGEDFLLTGWFKIATIPTEGERMLLLQKYDRSAPGIPGYALGLERHVHEIVPVAYWSDGAEKGRWYRFSKLAMAPRDWVFLALSLHDGHILGMHAGVARGSGSVKVRVLGGYNLDPPVSPSSLAPLKFGSVGADKYKGWIGPFGIFSKRRLHKELSVTFEDLTRSPLQPPSTVSGDEIKLWSQDGRVDLSPFKHSLLTEKVEGAPRAKAASSPKRRSKGGEKGHKKRR